MSNRHYCFIPGCKSGRRNDIKITVFHARQEDLLKQWIKVVPLKNGRQFTQFDGICEKHFKDDDVIREWKSGDICIPYTRPRLAENAIPCLFHDNEEIESNKCRKRKKYDPEDQCLFKKICHTPLGVPNSSWSIHGLGSLICINEVCLLNNLTPYVGKQITINNKLEVKYFYKMQLLSYTTESPINSIKCVENLIEIFDKQKICKGGPSFNIFKPGTFECNVAHPEESKWRHKDCKFLVDGIMDVCEKCKNLTQILSVYKKRSTLKVTYIAKLRNHRRSYEKIIMRYKKEIKKLQESIVAMKNSYRTIPDEVIFTKINELDLPLPQKTLMKECLSSAKFVSKYGKRYTSDWIMQCLLLYIRSTVVYKYIIKNKIMPLCSVSTIRAYLKKINIDCGIDNRFSKALKRKL